MGTLHNPAPPEFFIRVLPIGSDEWVAFDKYDRFVDARLAREILKQSKRYKGVEMMARTTILQVEGVDSIVLAEMQIAGSWTPAEQRTVRDRATHRRLSFAPNWTNLQGHERDRRLRWIKSALDELLQMAVELLEVDPDLNTKNVALKIGLPARTLKRLQEGEKSVYKALMARTNESSNVAVRTPLVAGEPYYKTRLDELSKESDMSIASLFVSMLELWESAPEGRRLAAIEAASQRGVVIRHRSDIKKKTDT